MTNMDISSVLKQTEELTLDEDKLSLLSGFIGNHFNDLTAKDFIQLLTPLVVLMIMAECLSFSVII